MSKYFDKFPVITYNGTPARNILARSTFDLRTKQSPQSFISHVLNNNATRPDIIADKYYDDVNMDWLVYMSNDITDPYYDTVLNDDAMMKFIVDKYGSLEYARELIVYYIDNWASEETSTISVANYDALTLARKKYFNPVIDYYNQITGYVRKKSERKVSTNQVRALTVDSTAVAALGEIFAQYYNGAVVARGQLTGINADDSIFYVQCITGTFTDSAGNYIKGKYINKKYQYEVSLVENPSSADNIPAAEVIYWTPITAYEHEIEKNEQKRNIRLLRKSLKSKAEEQLTATLRV